MTAVKARENIEVNGGDDASEEAVEVLLTLK